VQFYNQGSSAYSNYTTLFETSDGWANGTANNQIAKKGIPLSKLVIGKPVSTGDAANTGYVPVQTLAQIFQTARKPGGVWANTQDVGGMMGWKFHSDPQGAWIKQLKTVTERV
jgi:chitinase